MNKDRRSFIKESGKGIIGLSAISAIPFLSANRAMAKVESDLFFKISLAEWSLNKNLFGKKITNMDFPGIAKNEFGIHALEYVNQFFMDKANDEKYLKELKSRTSDLNVKNVLIMIDNEGHLADESDTKRSQSIENHYKWVEAAKFLGCHSIRVNAYATSDDPEKGKAAAVDGLSRLTDFAKPYGINIIVENHGGFSSNGKWLSSVMKEVNKSSCGTLPDFGNFCIERQESACVKEYDKYQGVEEMMPFAFAVSAKSYDFDGEGNETTLDYQRLISIVKISGYDQYIGIEYEGSRLSEEEGILATRDLLLKLM